MFNAKDVHVLIANRKLWPDAAGSETGLHCEWRIICNNTNSSAASLRWLQLFLAVES
jgi:hypothetical protein